MAPLARHRSAAIALGLLALGAAAVVGARALRRTRQAAGGGHGRQASRPHPSPVGDHALDGHHGQHALQGSPPATLTTDAIQAVTDRLPPTLQRYTRVVELHLREGRFQRSLSLLAGISSLLTGAEVAYEHYRGSYGQRVMWTPVVLSAALTGAGVAGAVSPAAARRVLRPISVLTLVDGVIGFGFHIRGIARKPGGWRLPVTNIVMGPPILAPLLMGVGAYLGLIASYLRPEKSAGSGARATGPGRPGWPVPGSGTDSGTDPRTGAETSMAAEIATGRYQRHLAAATIASAFFSGVEALYSHYKNGFRYRVAQATPLVVAPLLMGAAAAAIASRRAARTLLPAASIVAITNGGVGFLYHARGVLRMAGGLSKPVYNVIYGPPILAPLLFAASGTLGLLASLTRREP